MQNNPYVKQTVMMNTTHDQGVETMLLGTVLPSTSQQPHLELNIYSNSYTYVYIYTLYLNSDLNEVSSNTLTHMNI